ncbi:MAG: PAS domain-containing protein [Phycisphaerales bacterium]
MHDASAALASDVVRETMPSIQAGRYVAEQAGVRDALIDGDRAALVQICNAAVQTSAGTNIVAIFDGEGRISAINTVDANGQAFPSERVARILGTSFENRAIVQDCLGRSGTEQLAFQTNCGLTQTLFDSSRLAIAHSTPIRNEDREVIGVVSTRADVDLLADLAMARAMASNEGHCAFVTSDGAYFSGLPSESDQIVPQDALQSVLRSMHASGVNSAVEIIDEHAIAITQMAELDMMDGAELFALASAPSSWVRSRQRLAMLDAVAWPAAFLGVILLLGVGRVAFWRVRMLAEHSTTLADELGRSRSELETAVERLRIQRRDADLALASSNIGYWDLDVASGAVRASDHLLANFGISESDGTGTFEDLVGRVHPDDIEHVRSQFATTSDKQHNLVDMTYRLPNGSGGYRTMRSIGTVVERDDEGAAVRILGTQVDIDDLLQAENRLALAMKASGIGLWDWDIESDGTFFSDTFYTMLGYDPGDLPMTLNTWSSLCHDEDRDRTFEAIAEHHAGATEIYSCEHRLRTKDGNWTWIHGVGEVVERNANGSPKRMIGVHVDIDATKRMDLAMRSAIAVRPGIGDTQNLNEICRAVAGVLGVGFVGIARPVERNGKAAADLIAGWSEEGPVQPFKYWLAGSPCAEALENEICIVPSGVAQAYPEDVLLVEMGAESYAGMRLHDSNGRRIGLLVTVHTEPMLQGLNVESTLKLFGSRVASELERMDNEAGLRKARDAAQEASKSKSEFLANMSHEIRTPMTAILGYSDLLCGDFAGDPAQSAEAVASIHANARHLLTVINDILDVSKIEAGQMQVEEIAVNPSVVIEEAMALCRPRAEGKGLDFQVEYESAMPVEIRSDPTRLRQIVLNLLGNALKFTESGSITVRASCDPENQSLSIHVVDTGIGMTIEQLMKLQHFEAFAQADTSTTRNYGGTGLGMRISNALAEMLGGWISIDSDEGVGSTFTVAIATGNLDGVALIAPDAVAQTLIASRVSAKDPAAKKDEAKPLAGMRVLLAEDGPDNQRLISFHLKKAGADVIICDNGRIAAEHVEAGDPAVQPQVVLMDMQMPELDGYSATRRLREGGCTLPIIALTAHAMEGDRERCLDAGCDEYLTKPIDKVQLVKTCLEWSQGRYVARDAA